MNPIWVVGLVGGVVMVGFGVERMFIKGVVVGVTCGRDACSIGQTSCQSSPQ